MTRHCCAEEIGNLAMGNLPPGKTARVASHLASCPHCRTVSGQLDNVFNLLQSVHYAAMPQYLSAQLETTLASEWASMVARAPATEAGRRDLADSAARRRWSGLRPPAIASRFAQRALAAAAAAVVMIGGCHAFISHLGQSGPSFSFSFSSSSASPASGHADVGPKVSYGHSQSINAIKSNADFAPASLRTEVDATLANEERPTAGSTGALANVKAAPNSVPVQPASPQMDACVTQVAVGQTVALVEVARYRGAPAWIIAVGADRARPKQVWVVSTSCSPTDSHVIAHATLPSR
jgi:hypothetical protein